MILRLFGPRCARNRHNGPALLCHCLGQITTDPEFEKKFQRSIYVDDITFGAANVKETYGLYKKSKTWLAEGFNLRKFVSNSPELQKMIDMEEYQRETPSAVNNGDCEQNITSEDESYTETTLGDKENSPEILKVLGLLWRSAEDHLVFDIHHISELAVSLEPTKQNVVSLATRIYDPLGILSLFVVRFKMLCQQVCLQKVSWDKHLSGESLTQWRQLQCGLEQAQPIGIPRCYFHDVGETSYCLWGFCDASKRAYVAVVYLREKSSSK